MESDFVYCCRTSASLDPSPPLLASHSHRNFSPNVPVKELDLRPEESLKCISSGQFEMHLGKTMIIRAA